MLIVMDEPPVSGISPLFTQLELCYWPWHVNARNQRRLGDYTGMRCGQAHFVTYYRFLGSARHCSVDFAEVRTGELFQYCN